MNQVPLQVSLLFLHAHYVRHGLRIRYGHDSFLEVFNPRSHCRSVSVGNGPVRGV
nr:MAG TPA: hypothetical protein [Caudoviricetes sp.]